MFVAIIAGIVGYTMSKAGFSVVTLTIGFLLGEIAERTFFQSMLISNNNMLSFFSRPPVAIIFTLLVVTVVGAFWRSQQLKHGARHIAEAA
jgi:putative tricarboxylic transport membrane protein